MKIIVSACLLSLFIHLPLKQQLDLPKDQTTVLDELIHMTQQQRVPLAIIMGPDRSLCERAGTSDSGNEESRRSSLNKSLDALAYEAVMQDGIFFVRPRKLSAELQKIATYKYPETPALEGSIEYMGEVLQGWIAVTFNGAKGFTAGGVEGSDRASYKLPAAKSITAVDVANRIISLPVGGIYILQELKGGSELDKLSIRIMLYTDDLTQALRSTCRS